MTKSEVQYTTEFYEDLTEKFQAKVLHVDDEPSILKVARQCLEMEGHYQVDSAISVKEAEKKIKKHTYDVIVSDYMMPDRNGLEFLGDLRRTGNLIPFIMFTGKGREEVAVKALNLGADQYVNKIGEPETVYLELAHGIHKAIERRRAHDRIIESEEKFRNIFESANDAMIYLDMTGRILDVNKKTIDIYGGEKRELIGKHFTKLGILSTRDVPRLMKAFSSGLSGKHPLLNINIKDWKGQKISLECQGSIAKTSHGKSLLVIARDVTKRIKAEEGMKKSEKKYRALLEETPIGICNIDVKGTITYVNEAFENILGYSRNGILGESVFKLARKAMVLSDKQLEPIIDRIKGRLAGRKKSKPMTITLKRKDGTLRWVEAESKLIKKFGMPIGLQAIIRDVTEQKISKEKVRESEERFRSIVENSHGGIGIVDDSFKIKYVNDRACEILGYSKKEVVGQDFRKFLDKNSQPVILDRYQRRQRGEKVQPQYEFDMIRKDGEKITVEMKATIITDNQGRIQTLAEIIDITEHKKVIETLRENEEKFRNLAEQLPNMVFINKNGRVVYANNKCNEIMGYSDEEIYSSDFDFLTLIAPECIDTVVTAFNRHKKGEDVHPYEYTLITKDGKRVEAIINTKLIKYDGENAILGIVTDISERSKMEKELRSSKKRSSLLFQYAPDAYYLSDLKGTFIDGNRAAEELTGYTKNELIGKSFLKLGLLSPRQIPKAVQLLAENALGKPTGPDEFLLERKNGVQVHVEIRTFPVKIDGRTLVLGIARDITERKISMDKLQKMNEKLNVVGRLARHDVQNKLSVVTGNTFLINKGEVDAQTHEYLEEIESAVRQIERIFEFSRTYEQIGVEKLEYVEVTRAIENAISLLSDISQIKIINDCEGLMVLADSLFRQIFYNLLDNSVKHGEKVSKIKFHYYDDGDQLNLIYEDDGIGIVKSEKERIFDEGYGKDTGYGLYLIRKICEVYGWTIRETGKYGEGFQLIIGITKKSILGRDNYRF